MQFYEAPELHTFWASFWKNLKTKAFVKHGKDKVIDELQFPSRLKIFLETGPLCETNKYYGMAFVQNSI